MLSIKVVPLIWYSDKKIIFRKIELIFGFQNCKGIYNRLPLIIHPDSYLSSIALLKEFLTYMEWTALDDFWKSETIRDVKNS